MTAEKVEVAASAVVQRWRRYGHDRAYVKVDDRDLGYRDLTTGEIHCQRPGEREVIERVTADLLIRVQEAAGAADYEPKHGASASTPADPSLTAPPPTPTGRPLADRAPSAPTCPGSSLCPDRDLAENVPGQSARQQADQLRAAAPVRTLIARALGVKSEERS